MKFKIIHIYIVEGLTRDIALEKFALAKKNGKQDDYFETDIVKKIDEQPKGWLAQTIGQVTGK